ncbi:hypothetical protein MPSEU_000961200 [Mayamaea pseudoterrestris]|nr:hypothetical protein MPSEU_000961200 [Mayamaea pseudoterrestris]
MKQADETVMKTNDALDLKTTAIILEEPSVMIEDHEEFPHLGLAPSAKEIADSGWVNLARSFVLPMNTKLLRHCASSPDMRRVLPMLREVHDDNDDEAAEVDGGCGDESFTLISTEEADAGLNGSRISFRDAILIKARNKDESDGDEALSPSRPRIRPAKYIVVQQSMTRCSRSTGDLQSMDSEVMGETDAMDYYHRKALGAKGRVSGLRMRPDEMKRKEMTLNKKNLQRASQA